MTDDIDQRLINALMADSRLSLKALAQVSGLSAPSVAERLRKLEERGVIRGYTLDVDPRCFGYQFQAIVRIRPLPGRLHEVERQIQDIAEFTECDKVTGDDWLHRPPPGSFDGTARHAAGQDQRLRGNQHRHRQEVPG
ncbi:putative transcriptional regulator [Pseudomonas aeruginosa]|nr:putative transcriptional regulator [Pseudomonas aeruginosa]